MIECRRLDGSIIHVPQEDLTFRPAAYAIIVHDRKLLLLTMKHTGKYHLPGGGIQVGETISETLHREIREETGIEIQIGHLAHFEELFFFYDPSRRAYHGFHFYYHCTPLIFDLMSNCQVVDGSAEYPRWIDITKLQVDDFQAAGAEILNCLFS